MIERIWNSLFSKRIETEGKIELLKEDTVTQKNGIISIYYGMYLKNTSTRVGMIDLRIGVNEELYYAGNIGYRVFEKYRGHHYAYYASKKVLELAREEYSMSFLYITCSPDNLASKKTLEKLSGHFVERAQVPSWHWLTQRNEAVKDIYFFNLHA